MFYLHLCFTNPFLTTGAELDLSEKLPKALLNIVLGMGIVFAVLIFMSIFIYLIRYIPRIIQPLSKKKKTDTTLTSAVSKDTVSEMKEVFQEENLIADTELVAVVTAAIMAYMGEAAPVDGLVVRSIKRAPNNRWQRVKS